MFLRLAEACFQYLHPLPFQLELLDPHLTSSDQVLQEWFFEEKAANCIKIRFKNYIIEDTYLSLGGRDENAVNPVVLRRFNFDGHKYLSSPSENEFEWTKGANFDISIADIRLLLTACKSL